MKTRIVSVVLGVLALFTSAFSLSLQSERDSMDGNWAVINGKKVFLSGMNVAWISNNSFGSDVGDKKADMNLFASKVKNIRKAGGNSLRWWLHTDGSNCPKIDETGAVSGLGTKTIENIKAGLDTAYAYGVVVSMCLFSFDMLVPGDGDGKAEYSSFDLDANYKFLTEPENIDTYLEKGLKPILESVGSHPAVMCWEVFNEPEGMLAEANWSHVTKKITVDDILRITNKIAGFVHKNSTKMASTGIASTDFFKNYSDESLIAAGGDKDGYLDFYMIHYYPEWAGSDKSPFHNPASHWNMDRPILIGEFPAKSWSTSMRSPAGNQLRTTKTIVDAYEYAYENGYAGAMSWCMSEPDSGSILGNYLTTAPALEALFDKHKDDIMLKSVEIEEMSGDYVMKLALKDLPSPDNDGAYNELGTSFSADFSGKKAVKFSIFVDKNSGNEIQMQMVIKASGEYKWSPAQEYPVDISGIKRGSWQEVSIPVEAFEFENEKLSESDLSDIKEILFQYWATDDTYSGVVYFDNIMLDNDTLFAFNNEGTAWSSPAEGSSVGLVKKDDVTSVYQRSNREKSVSQFSVKGLNNKVIFNLDHSGTVDLSVYAPNGALVRKVKSGSLEAGLNTITLKNLASGFYLASLRSGKLVNSTTLLVK